MNSDMKFCVSGGSGTCIGSKFIQRQMALFPVCSGISECVEREGCVSLEYFDR
jgi:hypothetical protein